MSDKNFSFKKSKKGTSRSLFKIGELADLFRVSEDSIRYYEKQGLLHPIRNPENNYRYYTMDDIRTMNTIREFLDLGFSTREILDFEKDRNLEHVTDMLQQEADVIDRQIAELTARKQNISARLHSIRENIGRDCSGRICVLHLPPRPVLLITRSDMPDQMINYELARFLSRQPGEDKNSVYTIGACDCYTLDTSALNADGSDYRTRNVFFYSPCLNIQSNHTLPAGTYLSACYRGDFSHTRKLLPEMLSYANSHQMTVTGDPMEFCHIDRYETSVIEEYLIELQVPVRENHT